MFWVSLVKRLPLAHSIGNVSLSLTQNLLKPHPPHPTQNPPFPLPILEIVLFLPNVRNFVLDPTFNLPP